MKIPTTRRTRHALYVSLALLMGVSASAHPQCPTGNLLSDAQFGAGTTLGSYTNNNVLDQWLEEQAVVEAGTVGCIVPTTPGVPGMLHVMETSLSVSQVRQVVVIPGGPSMAGDVAMFSARFNSPTAGTVCGINLWDGVTLVPIPGAARNLALDADCSTWEELSVCVPIPAGTERLNIDLLFSNGTIAQGAFVDDAYLDVCGCGPSVIGVPYCSANPNSTGLPSSLSAVGSVTASNNDVTLLAAQVPVGAFGLFITSRTQGFVMNPGGSSGNLCLSGAVGRYVGAGQVQTAGVDGAFDLALDLTMVPTPLGFAAVNPGDTWNFQAWHRDAVMGAVTSNFTNGVSISFQ